MHFVKRKIKFTKTKSFSNYLNKTIHLRDNFKIMDSSTKRQQSTVFSGTQKTKVRRNFRKFN